MLPNDDENNLADDAWQGATAAAMFEVQAEMNSKGIRTSSQLKEAAIAILLPKSSVERSCELSNERGVKTGCKQTLRCSWKVGLAAPTVGGVMLEARILHDHVMMLSKCPFLHN